MKITDIVEDDYEIWEERVYHPEIWHKGDLIFLFSGTGSGKTTLALEKVALSFLEHDKKVLYLVPRVILKEQIEKIMRTILSKHSYEAPQYSEDFKIQTYQEIEISLLQHKYIEPYDLIICDECHYFISDSVFNRYTKESYDFIFKHTNEKTVRLLLTATPDNIISYFLKEMTWYESKHSDDSDEPNYYSLHEYYDEHGCLVCVYDNSPYTHDPNESTYNVDVTEIADNIIDTLSTPKNIKLTFSSRNDVRIYKLQQEYNYLDIKYITEDNEIIEIIKSTQEKSIVFVSSKRRGGTLKENLKKYKIESAFITAENKNEEAKKTVEELTNTNTFSEKVLITTSVLDVGVNISSNDVKNVIISTTEPMEFLQMLGRIRIEEPKRRISLYIFKRSVKYFQNLKKNTDKKIECCEYLEEKEAEKKLDTVFQEELKPVNNLPNGYKIFLYLQTDSLYDSHDYRYKIRLNTLAPYYLRELHTLYDEICKMIQKDENYFIKKQLEWLGWEEGFSDKNFYGLELEESHIQNLQKAIENKAKETKDGVSFEKCRDILAELKPLVRSIDNKYVANNVTLSWDKFNKFCIKYKIPYHFTQEQYETEEEGKKRRRNKYYLKKTNPVTGLIDELNSQKCHTPTT